MSKPTYEEFYDFRLAEIYDAFCPLGEDSQFFLSEAAKVPNSTIIDLGCGTGILTVELANQGYNVIGVEPAHAMLEVAHNRLYAEKVQWIEGYAQDIPDVEVDLVLMTSHVAQFFLEDDEWQAALVKLHDVLKPGGRLIFDSRNPVVKPWEKWTRESTTRMKNTPHGEVEMWYDVQSVNDNRVSYQLHYLFKNTSEELTSDNELIYRSKEELIDSLSTAGFEIETIYGDWDKTTANDQSEEHIVIAKRI